MKIHSLRHVVRRHIRQTLTRWSWVMACLVALGVEAWNVDTLAVASGSLRSEYVVEHWDTEDGLPRSTVSAITQTRDGYLWLGTANGLARFDGVEFKVYQATTHEGMVRGTIVALLEDSRGRLWIGTLLGQLSRMESGRFTVIEKSTPGEISCLVEDDEGTVWVGTGSGLCRVVEDRVTRTEFGLLRPVRRLQTDPRDKTLWFDNDGELFSLHQGSVQKPVCQETKLPLYINSLFPKQGGGMWVLDYPQVLRETLDSKTVSKPAPLPFPTSEWTSVCLNDRQNNLWIGMNWTGLYCIKEDGQYDVFDKTNGLRDNAIRALYEDQESNIWVGTHQGGVHRLRRRNFQVYGEDHGLEAGTVKVVTPNPDGTVWVATRLSKTYRISDHHIEEVHQIGTADSLLFDSKGNLWSNSIAAGVTQFRHMSGRWDSVSFNPSLIINRSSGIFEDRDGTIWFGSHFGLTSFSNGHYTHHIGEGISKRFFSVGSVEQTPDGTVWVGSLNQGLFYLNADRTEPIPFDHFPSSSGVTALLCDPEGRLLAGTNGNGLWRWDGVALTRFGLEDGLPDLNICSLIFDDGGELWLGTTRGIARMTTNAPSVHTADSDRKVRFVTYGRSDGLLSAECTPDWQPSACKTEDGRLWFATIHGVAVVDPKHLVTNAHPPPVKIQSVLATTPSGLKSYEFLDSEPILILEPEVSAIEIHYAGLSFTAPRRVEYRYRLNGLDKDWVAAGYRRTAYYSHVPAGTYEFQVIAANNEGIWNSEGATIVMKFEPTIWETTWFRVAMVLLLASLSGGLVRYISVQKLNHQLAVLEQKNMLELERTRIARDMHDHLGSQLTHIGMLSQSGELESPAKMIRITEVTRDLIQKMDHLVWAVNPKKDRLEDLVGYCTDFAHGYLEASSLVCRIQIPEDLPDFKVSSKIRYEFFLVLCEVLNNIVKHSGASKVELSWELTDESVCLTIQDDGGGFDLDRRNDQRNGLSNMRSRMEALQGRLSVQSRHDCGTTVILSLPRSAMVPLER